jgi:phosphate transport system substrate-binding protein
MRQRGMTDRVRARRGAMLAVLLALARPDAIAAALDPALADYVPRPVKVPADRRFVLADGTIRIVAGNRGMGVVVEGFNRLFEVTHPGVRFKVEYNVGGNTVNIAALVHDTTLFSPLGRDMNAFERASYASIVGGAPLEIRIAHGTLTSPRMTAGLAVYVNEHNPVRQLTMAQLARIFTTGAPGGDITHWGQLGATGDWAARRIRIYGTPEASGYGDYMVNVKWAGRSFAPGYESYDLAAQIVDRVGTEESGIGFAGMGFVTGKTRLVALAEQAGGPYLTGTEDEIASGRYPLDRTVALAVRREVGQPLSPLIKEYLRLVLSKAGQQIVAAEQDGFVPLTAEQVRVELTKLEGAAR